jgi:TorA maturation chaperone TorD
MFKLFSTAFEPPTTALASTLSEGILAEDVAAVWKALDLPLDAVDDFCSQIACYKGADAEQVLHEIRRDWTHMYVGDPPLVDRSEGVWRRRADGQLNIVRMINKYSVEVADFMRECGVKRREKFNDCIDNIEEELDFCAFLANQPDYLVEMGRDPLDELQKFVDEHLQKWVPGYCADVRANARTPYYQALSDLMAAFMRVL